MPNEDEAPFKIHLTFLREKFTFLINLLVLDVAQHRECSERGALSAPFVALVVLTVYRKSGS